MAKKATATEKPKTPAKKTMTKKAAVTAEAKPKAAKKSDATKTTKPRTTRKAAKGEAKPAKTTRTRKTSPAAPIMSEEHIRVAAYYRWVERGMTHGTHEEDWLEAEKQIKE